MATSTDQPERRVAERFALKWRDFVEHDLDESERELLGISSEAQSDRPRSSRAWLIPTVLAAAALIVGLVSLTSSGSERTATSVPAPTSAAASQGQQPPARSSSPIPASPSQTTATTAGFHTKEGIRCAYGGSLLTCALPDGKGATLNTAGVPTQITRSAAPAGGSELASGQKSNFDSLRCGENDKGLSCYSVQNGHGFFINSDGVALF